MGGVDYIVFMLTLLRITDNSRDRVGMMRQVP